MSLKWMYPLQVVIVSLVFLLLSRGVTSWRPARPWSSIAVGILVFIVWIGPDVLLPNYRNHWLFQNGLFGQQSTLDTVLQTDYVFFAFRLFGAAIVVPIVEELFWRGWLMRYLIDPGFERVPLGAYSTTSFWITAIFFAAEHGIFWDVGLAAGVIYNWWMIRTRSLADCMLAHAVTNATLGAYVIAYGHWQYW